MRGDAWVQDKGLKIPYATTYTWNLKKKKKNGSKEPRVRTGIKTQT